MAHCGIDLCAIAPEGSQVRSLVDSVIGQVPAWNNGLVRCDNICFHDICAQDVLLYHYHPVEFYIDIPVTDGCRGVSCIPEDCYVVVKCAQEELVDCKAVQLTVNYDVVAKGAVAGSDPEQPCYMMWNYTESLYLDTFLTFPWCQEVTGEELADYLRRVDGSCITADIECQIEGNRIYVCGKIVDKLWKHENLIVLAAQPFEGITVNREFIEQQIPTCDV
jgi:hypothetical protein